MKREITAMHNQGPVGGRKNGVTELRKRHYPIGGRIDPRRIKRTSVFGAPKARQLDVVLETASADAGKISASSKIQRMNVRCAFLAALFRERRQAACFRAQTRKCV